MVLQKFKAQTIHKMFSYGDLFCHHTVEKYTGAEASIGSRISLHSVRKKMTRVKQSITQRTGLRHKVRWVLITGRCFFKNRLLFLIALYT